MTHSVNTADEFKSRMPLCLSRYSAFMFSLDELEGIKAISNTDAHLLIP